MKAILVIDMPTHCGECPVKCRMRGINHVPTWCPLKPLLQKKWHEEGKENECEEWYRNGWNDCLDAITGDKDEIH